jgi:hypothetical protein
MRANRTLGTLAISSIALFMVTLKNGTRTLSALA